MNHFEHADEAAATASHPSIPSIGAHRLELRRPIHHLSLRVSNRNTISRDELYRYLLPLINRLVRQYGHSDAAQESLICDINLKLYELYENYNPLCGTPLVPYMIRGITASISNVARPTTDALRANIDANTDLSAGQNRVVARCACSSEIPQFANSVERRIADALPGYIRQLPNQQQKVLIWRYYEGRSLTEIAQILKIREASVRTLLQNALESLLGHLRFA